MCIHQQAIAGRLTICAFLSSNNYLLTSIITLSVRNGQDQHPATWTAAQTIMKQSVNKCCLLLLDFHHQICPISAWRPSSSTDMLVPFYGSHNGSRISFKCEAGYPGSGGCSPSDNRDALLLAHSTIEPRHWRAG